MLPRKRKIVAGEVEDLQKKTRAGEREAGTEEEGEAAMAGRETEIDEDLHSRQLAVYGRETMKRLFGSNVLVSRIQGLGAEIAKNLVLAGVKSVTLHDDGNVELWDLSSNFFLSEDDVGQNRAQACAQKLQELNNAVLISALTGDLTKEHLSNFQAVVFTDISLEKAVEFDDYCHSHQPPIAFIKSEVRGLFGSVFCDFGPEFTVFDVDGEEPHTGIVASISNDNPALVSCVDDGRLGFQDGDLVVFSEVHGMTELNDGKPRKVKNARPYSFQLEEDTSSFGAYFRGGIVTQVKLPKIIKFKPLKEAMVEPGEFLMSDFSKFERPPLLHLAFQALDKFRSELKRFPVAGSSDDVQKVIEYADSINETLGDKKLEGIDKKLLHHFASGSRAVLNPMAAMFGGIVGQEVVKACSGKFHPLYQFFYFDSVESLPVDPLEPSDLKQENTRYDAQISVFGSKLHNKLEEVKIFMIGSGALGCEFLKNLALMGVSCSQNGKLIVTDDDVIKKSNLSHQFLFRQWNIGQPKSKVAATAAMGINPKLHVEALQDRASPETENVFNDAFWENLDAVVNALDNVTARMYIDSRCVYFQKPLLESGTLGAKCNTQMVIPHLTENYGASRDPPEKQAPMCTVHSFPHNIDHCITWARSEFEGLLEKTPTEVNAFLSNPTTYVSAARTAGDAQARDQLERVIDCLDKDKCETFQDSITWARLKFEDYFSNCVKQLAFTFPEDSMTSSGAPFWSAPKRFPRPVEFSSSDPSQLSFIMAASILRAETFGIPIPEWAKTPNKLAAEAVDKVIVPDFQPKQGVKIVTDEKATSLSSASVDDVAVIEELIAKLEDISKTLPSGFHMNPIQFEKDDDTNFHMDVIAGFANMRARNYSIPEVDKLKAKFIAARIIPAIATSTAMVTGLVCLELYKVLAGGHKVEDYSNTFANLAIPLFSIAEPVPPTVGRSLYEEYIVHSRKKCTKCVVLILFRHKNDNTEKVIFYQSGIIVASGNTSCCVITPDTSDLRKAVSDFLENDRLCQVKFCDGTIWPVRNVRIIVEKEKIYGMSVIIIYNVNMDNARTVKFADSAADCEKIFTCGYNSFREPTSGFNSCLNRRTFFSGSFISRVGMKHKTMEKASLFVHGCSTGGNGDIGSGVFNEDQKLVGLNVLYTKSEGENYGLPKKDGIGYDAGVGGIVYALDLTSIRSCFVSLMRYTKGETIHEAVQLTTSYLLSSEVARKGKG